MSEDNTTFNPVSFMKEQRGNQKSVPENMKNLGASDEAIAYAMHIIDSQRKQLIRSKGKWNEENDVIQSLNHKIMCQRQELHRLNGGSEEDFRNAKREALPIDKRTLKVVYVDGDRAKITINPCDGRVELKVPKSCDDNKMLYILGSLINKVKSFGDFDPYTYRGNVFMNDDHLCVNLKTESKIHKGFHFSVAI